MISGPKVFLAAALAALTALFGISYAQSPSSPKASAELQLHGQKLSEAVCASCHGVDGNSTDPQYPKLAGQKAYYLHSQLYAFKNGTRKSEVMAGIVAGVSDAQIAELARYFSDQPVKPDTVKDQQLAALGARIFNYPSRGAPPCAACHAGRGFRGGMMGGGRGMMGGGMGMMMGNTVEVPNLSGQHASYLLAQLDAFAAGTRPGTVMGPIARAWREQDRRAVAEYLSGLR